MMRMRIRAIFLALIILLLGPFVSLLKAEGEPGLKLDLLIQEALEKKSTGPKG